MGNKSWSDEELESLRVMAKKRMTAEEIGKVLGRSKLGVRAKAMHERIPLKDWKPQVNWTPEMDALVFDMTIPQAAKHLGVPNSTIKGRRDQLRRKIHPEDEIDPPIIRRIVKATEVPPLHICAPRSVFDMACAMV